MARIFSNANGAATTTSDMVIQIFTLGTAGNLGSPDVAGGIDPSGVSRFWFTWHAMGSSALDIRAGYGFANGTIWTWVNINSLITTSQRKPSIAYLTGSDRAIISWEGSSTLDVYYRMAYSNYAFYAANQTTLVSGLLTQSDIQGAFSNTGTYLFAYTSNQNSSYDIYFQAFSSSQNLIASPPRTANDDLSWDQFAPAVAGGNYGQFLVAYTTSSSPLDNSGSGVLAKFVETQMYYAGIPNSKSFTWTEDTPFYFSSTGIKPVYPFYGPGVMNATVQILNSAAASFSYFPLNGVTVTSTMVSTLTSTFSTITSMLDQIVIMPTLNYASNYVLRLTIADTASAASSQTVDLNMVAIPINDPPTWVTNTMNITEGGTITLSSSNIAVTDVDSPLASIQFSVITVTSGAFYVGGVQSTYFTMTDLSNANVQFTHDGYDLAPTYTLSAYDGQNSAASTATVYFTPVNDPPQLINNTFWFSEGNIYQVTTSNIGISDDSPASSLIITPYNISHAQFLDATQTPLSNFTYADALNGVVYVQHDGSETAPYFSLALKDDTFVLFSQSIITFVNVNDAPTVSLGAVTITQGSTVILTSADISVTDPDSPQGSLWVVIDFLEDLQVKDLSTNAFITTNFSVSQLSNQQIAIIQTGTPQEPRFAVHATDGSDSSASQSFVFDFIGASPSPSPSASPEAAGGSDKKSSNTVAIAAGAGGGGGLLAVALVLTVLLLRKKKKSQDQPDTRPESGSQDPNKTEYRAIELSAIMTNSAHPKSDDPFSIDYRELEIGQELGRGAFGVVYKAQWRNGDCVVKQLDIDRTDQDAVKQFLKEAETLKGLRMHPNVCSLLGVCTDPRYPVCIVMEYLPGGSLHDYLAKGKLRVDAKVAVQLYRDIASGMAHIHQEGLLHCDLACRNLLVQPRGQNEVTVKIADFGLAKNTEGGTYSLSSNSKFPIRWTAPEVFETGKMSKASDVWSFGVVMWEILEQKVPYYELGNQDIAAAICNKGYRLAKPTKTECPDELYNIMMSCFSSKPEDRPSFVDLVHTFKSLVQQMEDASRSPMITAHVTTGYSSISDEVKKGPDSTETVYEQRGSTNSESIYHN